MADKATDKRPQFFMIEDAVVENFNLDPFSGWLYVVIVKHADRKTGEAFPGIARLCRLANMSRAQVMRSIKVLEDNHLLRVERDSLPSKGEKRQRAVNHYFVLSATGSIYQQLGVVSTSNYPNSVQQLGVVSGVDCNKNQVEPESKNTHKRASKKPSKTEVFWSEWSQVGNTAVALLNTFGYDTSFKEPQRYPLKFLENYLEAAKQLDGENIGEFPAAYRYLMGKVKREHWTAQPTPLTFAKYFPEYQRSKQPKILTLSPSEPLPIPTANPDEFRARFTETELPKVSGGNE